MLLQEKHSMLPARACTLKHMLLCSYHELKYQCQASCGLVIEHLKQLDDMWVGGQPPQSLDLAQVVDLAMSAHRCKEKGVVKA
jgi:hypothetical protein